MDIPNIRVNTAGAYACFDGYYLFAMGIQPYSGHIPIVRLGGHLKNHETGWQCAVREVYEEANLHIQPILPPSTYLIDWDDMDGELQEIQWRYNNEPEPAPVLVVTYRREQQTHLLLMYFAQAEGFPKPSSEVKGLLLLTEQEVHRLHQESLSLEQYSRQGGKAILNAEFDTKLVLKSFAQLRLLARILKIRSKARAAQFGM